MVDSDRCGVITYRYPCWAVSPQRPWQRWAGARGSTQTYSHKPRKAQKTTFLCQYRRFFISVKATLHFTAMRASDIIQTNIHRQWRSIRLSYLRCCVLLVASALTKGAAKQKESQGQGRSEGIPTHYLIIWG
jgi:hypothetical protein